MMSKKEKKKEASKTEEKKPKEKTAVKKPKEDKISRFKAERDNARSQLAKSLELNDKVLAELDKADKEVSQFKQIKRDLETVIEQQTQEITQLKDNLESLKQEKLREKYERLAKKWIRKYNLSDDKLPSVISMLAKFEDEQELDRIEDVLGLSGIKEKPNPVALTENSDVLVEQFADKEKPDYESMGQKEKLDYLHEQLTIAEKFGIKNK